MELKVEFILNNTKITKYTWMIPVDATIRLMVVALSQILTTFKGVTMNFGTYIHTVLRMNCDNFLDPLAVHSTTIESNLNMFSSSVHVQIPARAIIFPSASAALCS